MRKIIELYKLELEEFLATLSIFKGDKIINTNEILNEDNRKFLKDKFIKMKANNVNEEALDIAIKELMPYLYMID